MNNEFHNESMQQAMADLRKDQNHGNLLAAAQALLNTKVMIPAKWDREPEKDEYGQLRFDPQTKVSLMVIQAENGSRFFPAFTDMEEVKKFYKDHSVTCLILSMDQWMPFLESAKENMNGIVVDPAGVNMPFKTEFLEGIQKANKKSLAQNTIHKGQNIHLKNAGKDAEALEAALITSGFHEPDIRAIYLKERLEEPGSDKTHWFIVVDSDKLDTGIFSRIGETCRPVCNGKDMEFMFANQKLGQDVAKTSVPIYSRAVN